MSFMSFKFTLSAASLLVLSTLAYPAFADTTDTQAVNEKIDSLQQQINTLKRQVRQQKHQQKRRNTAAAKELEKEEAACPNGNCGYYQQRVSIGPYINQNQLYDGSELVINLPSIREDARLLLQQQQTYLEAMQMGFPEPLYPRLVFSGKLEGLYTYTTPYSGRGVSNINFSGAELDTIIQGASYITGYLALDYDPNEANDGSRIFMNRAFITIGNLVRSPFYATIGQIYVPFGRYNSAMVTTPSTQALARTRVRSLEAGIQQVGSNAFHAELYTYQGLTSTVGSSNTNNQWGGDAGYIFKIGKVSGEIGSGYISNLGDSQGMNATVYLNTQIQQHNVPALDGYASLAFSRLVLIGEYIAAIDQFNLNEANYSNQGAQPTALHTEIDVTFNTGSKPSSIGVGYDNTTQAVAVDLPQNSYEIFYNVNVFRNTNFALEYRHDINYGTGSATTIGTNPTPTNLVNNLGKDDNIISAQFDLYF